MFDAETPPLEERDVFRMLINTGASLIQQQRPIPDFGPMPSASPLAIRPAGLGALPLIGGGLATVARVGVGLIRSAAGWIVGVMTSAGKRISVQSAVAAAKKFGIPAAAAGLGITVAEMAEMVVQDAGRKRRGKGVTAAQIKTTRRTMKVVMGLHRQIVSACGAAGARKTKTVFVGGKKCR